MPQVNRQQLLNFPLLRKRCKPSIDSQASQPVIHLAQVYRAFLIDCRRSCRQDLFLEAHEHWTAIQAGQAEYRATEAQRQADNRRR